MKIKPISKTCNKKTCEVCTLEFCLTHDQAFIFMLMKCRDKTEEIYFCSGMCKSIYELDILTYVIEDLGVIDNSWAKVIRQLREEIVRDFNRSIEEDEREKS